MDDKDQKTIPYIAFELTQAKHERTVKRLVSALILSIILLFACNAAWLYAWCQYDYSSEQSVDIDAMDGIANYIGGKGVITNGTDSSGE